MPFATEEFPEFPYAVVLGVHAAHPAQFFALWTHGHQGEPHSDNLEEDRQEGPLQADELGRTARPNLSRTGHRIASPVFPQDGIVVRIGYGEDAYRDTVVQKQALQEQAVPEEI